MPRTPDGRTLIEYIDSKGFLSLTPAPGQHVCDFCLDRNPTWEYPCGPVPIVGNHQIDMSDDQWLACDTCHELIESGDFEWMVKTMARRQRAHRPTVPGWVQPNQKTVTRIQRENVRNFLKARTGDATPFVTDA